MKKLTERKEDNMNYIIKPQKFVMAVCFESCDCKSESSSYCYCNQPGGYSACAGKK